MGQWRATAIAGTLGYMTKIGIIGGGNIGEALLSGIIADGGDAKKVIVADRAQDRLDFLKEKYGVVTTLEAVEAAEGVDYLFNCVKPDGIVPVFQEVADVLDDNDDETVVVSVAAGVTLEAMESALPAGTPVVRIMPNTPMLVGKGTSALAGGRFTEESHLEGVQNIMSKVGTAVIVKEKDLDAVTAVSGSGPAYFFLAVEALVDAGVQQGLPRPLAEQLAVSTIEGAAAMMVNGQQEKDGDGPSELRAKVTSPGGTTAAALRALEENGLRKAFFRAAEECANRSRELG